MAGTADVKDSTVSLPAFPSQVEQVVALSTVRLLGDRDVDGGTAVDRWFVDSGCTDHMVCNRDWMTEYYLLEKEIPVFVATDAATPAVGVGTVLLQPAGTNRTVAIRDVLHVPGCQRTFSRGGR